MFLGANFTFGDHNRIKLKDEDPIPPVLQAPFPSRGEGTGKGSFISIYLMRFEAHALYYPNCNFNRSAVSWYSANLARSFSTTAAGAF